MYAVLCGSAALGGCQGGATVGAAPFASPTPTATPVGTPTVITPPTKGPGPTPTPTAVGATPTATPTLSPTPSPAPSTSSTTLPAGAKIYVSNHSKDSGTGSGFTPSVTIYAATASGNTAPLATLAGTLTNEQQVQFPAVDTAGNLWLSDQGTGGGATAGFVSKFLPTKLSGNQPPAASITQLYNPEGIAFDSAGDMYVATESAIDIYPTGSTTLMHQITGVYSPYGIFVDANNLIYVAESNGIEVFAAGATGAATPVQEFDTPSDMLDGINSCLSIAADTTGKIYCANFNNSTITQYAAGATGTTVTPMTIATDPTLTAIDEPYGIFVDGNNILYVANYGNNSVAYGSVTTLAAFAATATVISGTSTGLNSPYGIYVR